MSAERRDGIVYIICDYCGEEFEGNEGATVRDVEGDAVNDGWSIIGSGGRKQHFCEQCSEEMKHAEG